ncbi:MAG: hypothetical protein EBV24_11890 [Actinobacteria bacterium]|nr:hypothetical protein [Actinomycetota bacterium]
MWWSTLVSDPLRRVSGVSTNHATRRFQSALMSPVDDSRREVLPADESLRRLSGYGTHGEPRLQEELDNVMFRR